MINCTEQIGPADTLEALDLLAKGGAPYLDRKILVTYREDWNGSPIVYLCKGPATSVLLAIESVNDSSCGSYPLHVRQPLLLLEFPDEQLACSALDEEKLPTAQTFAEARGIVQVIYSWTMIAEGRATDFRGYAANASLRDLPLLDELLAHLHTLG